MPKAVYLQLLGDFRLSCDGVTVDTLVTPRLQSLIAYLAAIVAAFFVPYVSLALYAFVALIWLVPDRRVERAMAGS